MEQGGGTRVVGIYDDPLIAVGLANGGYMMMVLLLHLPTLIVRC